MKYYFMRLQVPNSAKDQPSNPLLLCSLPIYYQYPQISTEKTQKCPKRPKMAEKMCKNVQTWHYMKNPNTICCCGIRNISLRQQ